MVKVELSAQHFRRCCGKGGEEQAQQCWRSGLLDPDGGPRGSPVSTIAAFVGLRAGVPGMLPCTFQSLLIVVVSERKLTSWIGCHTKALASWCGAGAMAGTGHSSACRPMNRDRPAARERGLGWWLDSFTSRRGER